MKDLTPPIDGETRFIALLGYPVEHTLSPRIHNAALQAQGLNVRYGAFAVTPHNLEAAVSGVRSLGFLGANVTLPHKASVLPMMDELTPEARAVGAVNTIVCRNAGGVGRTRLVGDNTDVEGFLAPIAHHHDALEGAEVVVLGSGGAARAVAYAIANRLHPGSLTFVARSPVRAGRMVEEVLSNAEDAGGMQVRVVPHQEGSPAIRAARLVVNATPVGMRPDVDASPWTDASDLHEGQLVYDLIYNPRATRFLQMARGRGAVVVDGLEMLIAQAAASYRQWTGREMPADAVRTALEGYGS